MKLLIATLTGRSSEVEADSLNTILDLKVSSSGRGVDPQNTSWISRLVVVVEGWIHRTQYWISRLVVVVEGWIHRTHPGSQG